jgi:hypothetical protein
MAINSSKSFEMPLLLDQFNEICNYGGIKAGNNPTMKKVMK